jgi:thiol-disulfide isomerase/thioredoxin
LDTGSVAPIVCGHRVADGIAGDALDTIRYEGKVTLLDFWYMSCAGCIMAIPALDSLRAELPRDSFQIISVNSIDGNANGMRRLPNFMKRNPMSTDVLIVEPKVPESFMINLYPRFFIVDGQGIIRYSTAGYYHALQQNLMQAMRKHQHK